MITLHIIQFLIACIIAFILGIIATLLFSDCLAYLKYKEPRNKVRFYVARDKDKTLWLYMGKPIREDDSFRRNIHGYIITYSNSFENFGLNINDYKDLKWEDEPVEVFLNFKD